MGTLLPGETLIIGATNGTVEQNFTVTAKQSSGNRDVGYIGILNLQNERRINPGLEAIGGIFFWIIGLVKWIYFINVAVGLMNLLPIVITDGGRMLKVALEKILGDAKKADKAWIFIGAIFIFTLLFALLINYSLRFLSFIGMG